jgi:hypothetical protein
VRSEPSRKPRERISPCSRRPWRTHPWIHRTLAPRRDPHPGLPLLQPGASPRSHMTHPLERSTARAADECSTASRRRTRSSRN